MARRAWVIRRGTVLFQVARTSRATAVSNRRFNVMADRDYWKSLSHHYLLNEAADFVRSHLRSLRLNPLRNRIDGLALGTKQNAMDAMGQRDAGDELREVRITREYGSSV